MPPTFRSCAWCRSDLGSGNGEPHEVAVRCLPAAPQTPHAWRWHKTRTRVGDVSSSASSTSLPPVTAAAPVGGDSRCERALSEKHESRATHLRLATILVIALISLYAETALLLALTSIEQRADDNASLSELDRRYGTWRNFPRIIRDRSVVEKALATIPERAEYRVLIGPRWEPALQTRWTSSLERDFIRFHLMPRRLTSEGSPWVICLACSRNALGRDVKVLARGRDGMLLLRVEQ